MQKGSTSSVSRYSIPLDLVGHGNHGVPFGCQHHRSGSRVQLVNIDGLEKGLGNTGGLLQSRFIKSRIIICWAIIYEVPLLSATKADIGWRWNRRRTRFGTECTARLVLGISKEGILELYKTVVLCRQGL